MLHEREMRAIQTHVCSNSDAPGATMRSLLLIAASVIHVGFRLAYFFYIGLTLKWRHARDDEASYSDWLRFKKEASFILNVDGLTLGLVTVLSAASLKLPMSFEWTVVMGIILICAGIGVKLAAYRVVGDKGYYWYNFFCGDHEREYTARGVYRYLDNPMYTFGYLHAFGFPLVFRSLWGLVFALFDWLIILAFHYYFERPHTTFHREREMRLN